ncbi:MAG TPA: 3-hydroxybutyryl-CoA dehydrogenase [Mycobacteriales bacterium]|nr:3-hydroxybutyryl-CoA dehydrogenase [Mycobacteriales bacterium]
MQAGVVGGGIMGAGIAEVVAVAGNDVTVVESTEAFAEAARGRIDTSLQRAVKAGRATEEQAQAALARISLVTDLDALADRELVIEAVPEDERIKTELFARLDAIVRPGVVLATNTSSIPITRIAAATGRPDRVVGIHFFNPVPVLPLVEIVAGPLTGAHTVEEAEEFARSLGKRTIRAKDRAGFVVNALLVPYLLSAIRMVEAGHATPEDIDAGMVAGANHPMGPLALTDLIGLDTTAAVAESMYAEFKEPLYAPPPLLRRMVEAGLLGRKSGRGFFSYDR